MTLNLNYLVENLFEDDAAFANEESRSEFSLGLFLEEKEELVDLIPLSAIKRYFLRVEDNYGSVPEIHDGCGGGPLLYMFGPNGQLLEPEDRLIVPLSQRYNLSASLPFLNIVRWFNLHGVKTQLEKLWDGQGVQAVIDNYQEDEGRLYLIPCFTRPESPVNLGDTENLEPEFQKDLPIYDEIFFQRAIGAPQTVVRTGPLRQLFNQRFIYARRRPRGIKTSEVQVPQGMAGLMKSEQYAMFVGQALDLERASRSEIGFDYNVYDEHMDGEL